MSTTTISTKTGSVLLRAASTYGSVSGTNLSPDTDRFDSGTVSVPFDHAVVPDVAVSTIDRNEMRSRRRQSKPDVIGPYEGGSKVAVRQGDISLTLRLTGLGSSTSDGWPLHILLASMLEDGGEPSWTSDPVLTYHDPAPGSTAANAFYFRPTTIGNYAEGDVLIADVDGRPEALWVVEVDATPAAEYVQVVGASRHLTSGDTVRACRVFKNAAPGAAFDMRFDKDPDQNGGAGYRAEAFGCRVTSLTTTTTPLGQDAVIRVTFTINAGHIRYDHANASTTTPSYGDGPELQLIGSSYGITEALPGETGAAPYKKARVSDIYLGQLGITVTGEVQDVPDHLTVVGGERTIGDAMLDVTTQLTRPQTEFDGDLVDGDERWLGIALGSPGAGRSVAVVVPNAFSMSTDPGGRSEAGTNVVQGLQHGAESPRGTTTASAADSSFYLAVCA